MKKLLIIAILSMGCLPAFAQRPAKASNNGLLFEITGKGMGKPSYIFGTFHVVCERDMLPLDRINSLIAASEQTIMEIDMDDPSELKAMVGSGSQISDGKTLSDYLTRAQYAKVDAFVREYLGVSVDTMKSMKPSLITIRILTSPKATGVNWVVRIRLNRIPEDLSQSGGVWSEIGHDSGRQERVGLS